MAGLEQEPVDNALLLQRVVQLEHGAFFLLLPLLCGLIAILLYLILQSYVWDSNMLSDRRQASRLMSKSPCNPEKGELPAVEQDFVNNTAIDKSKLSLRKLSRRSSGLGDDLEVSQQKLGNYEKENAKLQEELLEVYALKKKFTDLLKVEAEKCAALEKELKMMQTRESVANSERLKLISEIENFHRNEEDMIEKISDLQDRLDHLVLDHSNEKKLRENYERDMGRFVKENVIYEKVIERFWQLRQQAVGACDVKQGHERAAILLQESEGFWSYGEMNKSLYEQAVQAKDNLAISEKELQACCTSLSNLQAQIEEENYLRRQVEDSFSHFRQKLSCFVEYVDLELKQLNAVKACLRHDVAQILFENRNWIISFQESFRHPVNKENEWHIINDEAAPGDEPVTAKDVEYENDDIEVGDNSKAALDEKGSAPIQLSQQERQKLEENTILNLHSEVSSLKQQLVQVTDEKITGLLELARLQGEFLKLQEASEEGQINSQKLSSGQVSPVSDHSVFIDEDEGWMSESPSRSQSQGYLKHLWPLRGGPELLNRTKSLSHRGSLNKNKEIDTGGPVRKLRIENASLRESLKSIHHLCQSANRLRLTLARVADESNTQTESTIQAAVDSVDGVISEALSLKVTLHSSLPVDDLGWNSIGSPLLGSSELGTDGELSDGPRMTEDLDIVSFFGLEIVRLVLLAAQLQKRFLGQNV